MSQKLIPMPLLQDGDRMDTAEFIRRWEAMPDLRRCELIEGVVYMPSPIGVDHGDYAAFVAIWTYPYIRRTPGVRISSELTWIMDGSNMTQPDHSVRVLTEYGGNSRRVGRLLHGFPELAVEVVVTTHDKLARKLPVYGRVGVPECLVVYPEEDRVEWYGRTDAGVMKLRPQPADGVFRSKVFPGLWLDVAALLALSIDRLAVAVEAGTRTPEHAAFVQQLAARHAG